jgi:hypothetical protein
MGFGISIDQQEGVGGRNWSIWGILSKGVIIIDQGLELQSVFFFLFDKVFLP